MDEELSRRLGREPEASEVAESLGISQEQLESLESTMAPVRSIHAPVVGLEATTLEDTLEDEQTSTPVDEIDREQVRSAVTEVLRDLSPRERKILDWRFGLENGGIETVTLGEIGKRLGISRERVRQIECAALARLRRAPSMRRLRGGISIPQEAIGDKRR